MNVLLKTKELESHIIRRISKSFSLNEIITPVQARIIEYLKENEDVYQKDIEKLLNLRRSTISGILHTMEKNDLILKQSINEDARLKKISLTTKARELYNDIKINFNRLNEEICNNISSDELNNFLNTLEKMINNIK